MPRLIRLYITQVLIGFAISAAFVGMLLWLNVMNLWHLVTQSSEGILAVVVMWVLNGIVFAGVQFSIAIMRMAGANDSGPRGGQRQRIHVDLDQPVPVRANAEESDPFASKR